MTEQPLQNEIVIHNADFFFKALRTAEREGKLDDFLQKFEHLTTRPYAGGQATTAIYPDIGWNTVNMMWTTYAKDEYSMKATNPANSMTGGFNHHSDGTWSLNT